MSKLALNQQLWNAVVNDDRGMVEAALVAGADPDFRDTGDISDDRHQSNHARSVLHEALLLGRVEAAGLLLAHGAEQTCDGLYGLSPLHLAALFGYEDLVETMIQHGADLQAVDGSGDNVLMTALMGEDPYDNPGQPIQAKLDDSDLAMRLVRKLVQAGVAINGVNEAGEAPLWNAVRYQSGAAVSEMISLGANPHQTTVFETSLVSEGAEALNRADALGQMSWRADESRAERQRALDVLRVLHGKEVALIDTKEVSQLELHYPSTKIQREVEGWWQQWSREATPNGSSAAASAPSMRNLRR